MNKVIGFLCAVFLFFLTLCGVTVWAYHAVSSNADRFLYWNGDSRNNCAPAMEACFKRGIPVFGSSELSASDTVAYPPHLFQQGASDFNMILFGRGHMQSILHAVHAGALDGEIKGRKCVLFLSPQWFEGAYSTDAFPSRLLECNYVAFLKNDTLSVETRQKVARRVESLMEKDPKGRERVRTYNAVFLNRRYAARHPVTSIETYLSAWLMGKKARLDFLTQAKKLSEPHFENPIEAEKLDWTALRIAAENAGKAECTNNDLYIYDSYYTTYVKDGYESGTRKDSRRSATMHATAEYDDFKLFLDVCKETGLTPLVVSIPVNGRWYDFTGFPTSERESYYQTIRDICSGYGVELADFSGKEYEPYFLKDVMHLGWKGWVYLDEAVYAFSQK